jgi:hypothetical protein
MAEYSFNNPDFATPEQDPEGSIKTKKPLSREEYVTYHKAHDPNFSEKEFDIHQARYEKISKGFWRNLSHPMSSTAIDIAHEEALVTNEDRNKKFELSPVGNGEDGGQLYEKQEKGEYKEWIKMTERIIANMKLKRDALTKIFPNAGSSVLFQKVLIQRMELRKVFGIIKQMTGINISILWPPKTGLKTATRNPDKVINGILESYRETLKIFGEPEKGKGIELLAT